MKTVGIHFKSNEAILVVLQKDAHGNILQLDQSTKFGILDSLDSTQVRQFRDQINATLNTIKPEKVGVLARQHRGKSASSPLSFKLEGILQLYDKIEVSFVWPATVASFKRKNEMLLAPKNKFQKEAFDVAYLLLNN